MRSWLGLQYNRCTSAQLKRFVVARTGTIKGVRTRKQCLKRLKALDDAPAPFRLLDLPPELREVIYKDALTLRDNAMIICTDDKCQSRRCYYHSRDARRVHHRSCNTSILLCSKQIYHEAIKYLYSGPIDVELKYWSSFLPPNFVPAGLPPGVVPPGGLPAGHAIGPLTCWNIVVGSERVDSVGIANPGPRVYIDHTLREELSMAFSAWPQHLARFKKVKIRVTVDSVGVAAFVHMNHHLWTLSGFLHHRHGQHRMIELSVNLPASPDSQLWRDHTECALWPFICIHSPSSLQVSLAIDGRIQELRFEQVAPSLGPDSKWLLDAIHMIKHDSTLHHARRLMLRYFCRACPDVQKATETCQSVLNEFSQIMRKRKIVRYRYMCFTKRFVKAILKEEVMYALQAAMADN